MHTIWYFWIRSIETIWVWILWILIFFLNWAYRDNLLWLFLMFYELEVSRQFELKNWEFRYFFKLTTLRQFVLIFLNRKHWDSLFWYFLNWKHQDSLNLKLRILIFLNWGHWNHLFWYFLNLKHRGSFGWKIDLKKWWTEAIGSIWV